MPPHFLLYWSCTWKREGEHMTEQTILIVEDDPDIRNGVRILLAGEG